VYSQLLIFPTLIGDDPWWHQVFTQSILDSGFIPEGYSYSKLPIMHLMIGVTSLITGLDYKMATMFSISLMQIICLLLFVFLLGRFIFNAKVGLLAALLLGVSNYFIHISYMTTANTLGVVLIPIIVYLLFKMKQDKSLIGSSLSILLMIVLILTHTIASMGMVILLFAFWSGSEVFERIYTEKCKITATLGIAIFFVVAMLAWWMYASRHLVNLVRLIEWGFSIDVWTRGEPVYVAIDQYSHNMPLLELLFNHTGEYLFFAIALIGAFYMISKEVKNLHSFNIGVGGMVMLGIVVYAILFRYVILSDRWHYLSQVLLSIPLATAFFLFSMSLKKNFTKTLFVVTAVAVLSFSMIMTPAANMDNPLFKDATVRKAYTKSELQVIETMLGLTDKKIVTDDSLAGHLTYLSQFPPERMFSIQECFYTKDFYYDFYYEKEHINYQNSIIVIRKGFSQNTITAGMYSFIKLDYDPAQLLAEEDFCRIYDSGSVSAFCWDSIRTKGEKSNHKL